MQSARFSSILAGLLCVGAMLVQHCGSDDDTFQTGACDGSTAPCGESCTTDESCPPGKYCSVNGVCTQDCTGSTGCPPGVVCSARGRCGGDFTPSDGGDGSTGDSCVELEVTLAKVIPTVELLIDQSSTMGEAFGDSGVSRWRAVYDALMDPATGIVKTLQGDVSFGLALYTARVGEPSCPRLIQVAPALGNYPNIAAVYADAGPAGGTPTGDAIDRLIGRVNGVLGDAGFAAMTTPGPKVIVLATDGLPDTCESATDGTPAAIGEAVGAAQASAAAGIRLYVIGVGPDVSVTHQKDMANAGAGQPLDGGDAAPFSTYNKKEFESAIESIVYGVRSCRFALNGTVPPGSESKGTVALNGGFLTYQDPNGWRLNTPSELELLGTSCQAVQTGTDTKLSVHFPCGAFVPR